MKRVIPIIRETMIERVVKASPDINVARAAKLMVEKGVGSIILVKSKRPVGILTERDVLMKVVSMNLKPSKVRVRRIMSKPIITIDPDADVTEAAQVMVRNKIRRLPVVQHNELIGIITSADLAAISPRLTEMIHSETPAREEVEQSVCEACGEMRVALFEVNGMWVCENCRNSMGG